MSSQKLSELREKTNKISKKRNSESQGATGNRDQSEDTLKSQQWYHTVRADRSRVKDAAEYYERAVQDAKPHITAIGKLENLIAETPGLAAFYRYIMTDAQQIRRWLDEQYEYEFNKTYQWLMTSEEAKAQYGELKTTEAGKFAKADSKLLDLSDDIRLMAYYEHLLDDVALGFQNRSIMLNHIVTIRKEGLEEVWVDPRRETNNQ